MTLHLSPEGVRAVREMLDEQADRRLGDDAVYRAVQDWLDVDRAEAVEMVEHVRAL